MRKNERTCLPKNGNWEKTGFEFYPAENAGKKACRIFFGKFFALYLIPLALSGNKKTAPTSRGTHCGKKTGSASFRPANLSAAFGRRQGRRVIKKTSEKFLSEYELYYKNAFYFPKVSIVSINSCGVLVFSPSIISTLSFLGFIKTIVGK